MSHLTKTLFILQGLQYYSGPIIIIDPENCISDNKNCLTFDWYLKPLVMIFIRQKPDTNQ